MKFGTGFALTAQADPIALRDMAQTLDGEGFDYVTTVGHLLCAPPDIYPGRPLPTYVGPFREPFVFFAYLAAVTQRLAFRTSILILPLFPTALVAKQAAEPSLLSGGRFQLGVGISWNQAEYEALGQDFKTRGRRLEEQTVVLKRLWTEPFVTFEGRFHKLSGVGLNQLPQQPIPVWIGCAPEEPLLRRVARVADGWLPQVYPVEPLARLRRYLTEAGRDPSGFGVTWRLVAGPGGPESWVETVRQMESVGVTDVTISAPPDVTDVQSLQRIIEGDNLEMLKLLQKSYLGKVKMIYIGPPYNTGNDFIYPDNYSESLQTYLEYTGQADAAGKKFSTNTETDGRFHSKWLNMMYPRLYLARNLLREDDVVFVSIDDHEVHNLRMVMNEVFGEERFVACCIWQKRYSRENRGAIGDAHDYLVVCAANPEVFQERRNLISMTEEQARVYKNPNNDPKGRWRAVPMTAQGYRPNQMYALEQALTLDVIRAMAERKPERVVCLDAGFAGNDQLKANAAQIFKTTGVTSFKTV